MPDEIPPSLRAELDALHEADKAVLRKLEEQATEVNAKLSASYNELTSRLRVVEEDLSHMRASLAQTATKSDIATLSLKFDQQVIGILRDSINAAPEWAATKIASQSNSTQRLIAGITLVGVLIALAKAFHL